ncbi:MAG: glycosyltransferase [Actinomycetota bacterium]|nr:MAG: glycosyltransferase [Actinomycetota bacterium]
MRILVVTTLLTDFAGAGGVESVVREQARALTAAGHSVVIVAATPGGAPADMADLDVRALPMLVDVDPRMIIPRRLADSLRLAARDVDIAHIHLCRDFVTTRATSLLARLAIPQVIQAHGMLDSPSGLLSRIFDSAATKRSINRARLALTLWEPEEQALRRLGYRGRVLRTVNSVGDLPPRDAIAPQAPTVLFASRIDRRKQPTRFVEMAQRVSALRPDVRFVMVGPSGDASQDLSAAIRALPPEIPLDYQGAVRRDDVFDLLDRASVLVLPSVREPFPMVAVEAMARGVPVVLSHDCGLAELAEQYQAADVVSPTVEKLTEAVLAILSDGRLAASLSAAGLRLVRERLSPAALGADLTAAYQSALAS